MKIYISVDDTDNTESPGSGQLSRDLAESLLKERLIASSSAISRHQLYVHPSIPYTSGNSSMCFSVETKADAIDAIISRSGDYLRTFSAPGSDPGLCVLTNEEACDRSRLFAFGCDAKRMRTTKAEAYALATSCGLHLSEHGGTGLGVIGALAGIGLRLHGNDGRFRGWLQPGPLQSHFTVGELNKLPGVQEVITEEGFCLSHDTPVMLADEKVKTVLRNHRQVIVVKPLANGSSIPWRTCTKTEVKTF